MSTWCGHILSRGDSKKREEEELKRFGILYFKMQDQIILLECMQFQFIAGNYYKPT